MSDLFDDLDSARLTAALRQHAFVTEILYHRSVTSTNDVAKARAAQGTPEGLLVVAEEQSAGRGRMGRRWWAPPGSALLTSLLFRPPVSGRPAEGKDRTSAPEPQQLGMLCALSAADAITEQTELRVDLKWPNDLLVGGHKVAGLLAESLFKGARLDAVIIGLGINVNVDPSSAPDFIAPATSLRRELGRPVERTSLLIRYLDRVGHRYAWFRGGQSPFEEWASRLVTIGQRLTAHLLVNGPSQSGPRRLSGLAQGVDEDGALRLVTADGSVHRLLAADISLSHPAGEPPELDAAGDRPDAQEVDSPHI
jgi:BirA family biotin operon repressor/biotin-[acetyl-CoA-carboxylase] ligase